MLENLFAWILHLPLWIQILIYYVLGLIYIGTIIPWAEFNVPLPLFGAGRLMFDPLFQESEDIMLILFGLTSWGLAFFLDIVFNIIAVAGILLLILVVTIAAALSSLCKLFLLPFSYFASRIHTRQQL